MKVTQKPGEASIRKVELELPEVLPSRLPTLQQACTEQQFAKNPAGCPEASFVGTATAHTPVLAAPLSGPAILVSHGGAAFPDLVFLLQGEGVHVELVGNTDIKKETRDGVVREITYSKFEAVPDAPISSFETSLPVGPPLDPHRLRQPLRRVARRAHHDRRPERSARSPRTHRSRRPAARRWRRS